MFKEIKSHEKIITGDELKKESKEREADVLILKDPKSGYEESKFPQDLIKEGWFIPEKPIGKSDPPRYRPHKKKYISDIFENKVWRLFHKMGCDYLNKRNFILDFKYKNKDLKQQIDVLAIKGKYIFLVEATQRKNSNSIYPDGWVMKSEAWATNASEINHYLKQKYPGCIPYFFFATKGLTKKQLKSVKPGKDYQEDLVSRGIVPLRDEEELEYFFGSDNAPGLLKTDPDIAFHQFLSMPNMLKGSLKKAAINKDYEVKNLNITTHVGWKDDVNLKKKKVYTFYLSPKEALPLVTVPHNISKSISDSIFFQRFVDISRLRKIHKYILRGGQFINNVIATFNADIKNSNNELQGLPGLISIIDGQHRVLSYALADDQIKQKHKILFTVFEQGTLSDEEQVRLFIDINKKQKPVSANLTSELELKATPSQDPEDVVSLDAMRIVQSLQDSGNALGERILGSEEKVYELKKLTITNIRSAIEEAQLYSKVNSNKDKTDDGLLRHLGDAKSIQYVKDFLGLYFADLIDQNEELWDSDLDGIYGQNIQVKGFILFLKDVLDNAGQAFIKSKSAEEGYESIKKYLDPVKKWIADEPIDRQRRFASVRYGASGPEDFRNILGHITWMKSSNFSPVPAESTKEQFQETDDTLEQKYNDFEISYKNAFHTIMNKIYPADIDIGNNYWETEMKDNFKTIYDSCKEEIERKINLGFEIQVDDPKNVTDMLQMNQIKTIVESKRLPLADKQLQEFFLVPLNEKNNEYFLDNGMSLKGKKGTKAGLDYIDKLMGSIRGKTAHPNSLKIPEKLTKMFDLLIKEFQSRKDNLRKNFS